MHQLFSYIIQDYKNLFNFMKNHNKLMNDLIISKRERIGYNLSITILILSVFCLFYVGQLYEIYSNLCYCIAGSLISIILSIIFEIRNKCKNNKEALVSHIYLLKDSYNILREIYMDFFSHPLDDDICKKSKNNIIYVNPITRGLYLDLNKLHDYRNFINEIDENTFNKHFREKETRFLIERLKLKTGWLTSLQITALSIKDNVDKVYLGTLLQFIGSIWNLININDYNWYDSQIKSSIFTSMKIIIPLHCMLLEMLQKQLIKYDEFLNLEYPKSLTNEYLKKTTTV